jgi:alpha-L-arabinofuranosidase
MPIPYRFTFAAALFCGDYIRVMLKPQHAIEGANYWQFINSYWGMLRSVATMPDLIAGKPSEWKKMPAFHVLRLWNQHFGTRLVEAIADAPFISFEGGADIPAMKHPSLTVCASVLENRNTIFLIVFNKHSLNHISTTVSIKGSLPKTARVWTLSGELTDTNLSEESVREVVSGQTLLTSGENLIHTFPAHSMSAIEVEIR